MSGDRIRIAFDDHRLVANAGLILPATLALRLGLPQLLQKHLDLGNAPGRANTGDKMMTLVASALAGGDCIDDADALRAGGTARVLGFRAKAPSTVKGGGKNGDQIDAYLARPLGGEPRGSVVLIYHMPGWDEASKEMARKIAYNGFNCISPNLHFREGQGDSVANSNSVRDAGGMPDTRTMGDVAAAYLRSLPYANGKVGIIGFCSGGRQVYLAACTVPGIDAAVDCWGGGVTAGADELTERQPMAPIDYTAGLNCPLLGIFGNEDARPSPEDVNRTEEVLKQHGKNYEFHRYDGAGHGFFAVDRPSYRQHAAVDAWQKVFAFYGQAPDHRRRRPGGRGPRRLTNTITRAS